MKKTSLYLDPELDIALTRKASREKISKAQLMRRALIKEVKDTRIVKIKAIGVGEGPGDVAENVDYYLGKSGFGTK